MKGNYYKYRTVITKKYAGVLYTCKNCGHKTMVLLNSQFTPAWCFKCAYGNDELFEAINNKIHTT